jgi:hypothetical protein
MMTTHSPANTVYIPASKVALEQDVRKRYLGDDIEEICDVAAISGSSVLVASAGLPLENRLNSFEIWRKNFLSSLRVSCKDLNEFMISDGKVAAGLESGEMSLEQVDKLIEEQKRVDLEAANHLRRSKKEALKSAISMNTVSGYEGSRIYPSHCVIRGDGEMKLFFSHREAKDWGHEGAGAGFHMLPFDLKLVRSIMSE